MYLSSTTESLEMVLAGAISVSNPVYVISYNDMTSTGMTLPQSSTQGLLNGITSVQVLAPPLAATNRQVYNLTLYNNDNREVIVTVRKDVSGTKYNIIKSSLAPGATLMWSRESGWRVLSGEKEGASTISREYTSDSTWTKPIGLQAAMIVCLGGGGGGGSGRLGLVNTNRGGGSGGGGGSLCQMLLLEKDLPNSVPIIIGAGGNGGAAVTTVNNGNNGIVGGDTKFGSLLRAIGGGNGLGGTTTTVSNGVGGSLLSCSFVSLIIAINGAAGGNGGTSGSGGGSGTNGSTAAPGGGGGGGITSGNSPFTLNSTGGGLYNNSVLITGPNSGVNGTLSACTFLYKSTTLSSTIGIGTGGAGGNQANPNGTNGGYGAGGGGGFGQLDTVGTSGAGGNGGGGICLVLEIY